MAWAPANRRLLAFSQSIRHELGVRRLEAPFRKLMVRLTDRDETVRPAMIALSVGEAWAVADPGELLELPPRNLRTRASEMSRTAAAALSAISDWRHDELRELVATSARQEGPYRIELTRLSVRSHGATLRTYYEVDEVGARILVDADGHAARRWSRIVVERDSPVPLELLLLARSIRVRAGRLEYVTRDGDVEYSVPIGP